ncbi:MAG: hypothetical protein DRI65_09875 [Chloroflexota bacterium]|nr:MAG: hypothetical protein DRI65_09875 [Chloroflexota bacterium]
MSAKDQNMKEKGIPLKLLILEDRAADAELMLHELRSAGYKPDWQRVETESDFREGLNDSLDLILADFNLPQFTGRQAIDILNQSDLNIPLIIITGTVEETALECLKQGAVDYLLKDRMGRLGPAVKKALEDKSIREDNKLAAEALRVSEERYRGVAETALTGLSIADPDEIITYSNPALADLLGFTNQELIGMPLSQIIDPAEYHRIQTETGKRKHGLSTQYETKMIRKDGELRTVIISASPLTGENGEYEGSQAVITDITERKQIEEKQRAIEDRYRAVVENSHNGILIVNEDYKFEYVNDPLCLILGRSHEEIIGHDFRKFLDEDSKKLVSDMYVRRRR